MRSVLTGSLQCVVFPASLAPLAAMRRAMPPFRSRKVEFGPQLPGESKGALGRGSWSTHREGGVPIRLFAWWRRRSDRDIFDIVPFRMLPQFAHYQSFQLGGASLFLHALPFPHRGWSRRIGRTIQAGPEAVSINMRSRSASRVIRCHVRQQKGPGQSTGPQLLRTAKAKELTSVARPACQQASADWSGSAAD
jgi:hypothetical protein